MIAGILFAGAVPALAQVTQMLHSTPTSGARDDYNGVVGCQFQVGATNVIVSHVGVFDLNNDGLTVSHQAGVFSSSLSSPTLVGQVVVPAGTSAYLTNGFRWMPLDPPLLLSSNTTYLVGGVVGISDGDGWQDAFAPTWNAWFIGSAATTTRHALYGPGGTPIAWPPPYLSQSGNNNTYGNVSLAYIEIDQARVGVQTTTVSISAGSTLSVVGFASGAPTITYQWYTNSISTPLAGQTSPTLVIANATPANSGTYFLTASNSLGGEQSANVTVSVTAFPAGFSKQPTNLTVFANYQASFFTTATGTPPVFYQWSRNGAAIPGATSSGYSLTANLTNNGDVYSCLASNYISGTPYTATSSNATLTVTYNLALAQQILHGARANTATNGATGSVGGQFTVGNSPVTVTHLGYYASQFTDTYKTNGILALDHRVAIFSANSTVLYGVVTVPAGTHNVVNGYMWAPLDPPLTLSTNTQYMLMAEVFNGSDPWGDTYVVPDLNPYFATACDATYWGAWPPTGVAGGYGGQMYSAPNLAVLAPTVPEAFILPTNVTVYAGANATLTAYTVGQPPLTLQWYTNGTPLTGQTNLTLTLANLGLGNSSSNYYVIATNPGGSVQSSNASVTVLPDTPSITQDIQPQDAFVHQIVQFVATAAGAPPLSYNWTFNSTPIIGATNSTLTIPDASAANVGNYQLVVTNNYGSATSSVASLAVAVPAWGSYPSAVMGTNLLAYYRFSDVNSGLGVATNMGSLGFAYDGTYEGFYSATAGPAAPNFEAGNLAVSLDGLTSDVLIPALNVTVTNATIAAWVYSGGDQPDNSAIYFHRGGSVFGLAVFPGTNTLKYTWAGGQYNFGTGLALPTNQWALVALVVTPTAATVYLQDGTGLQSATNVAAHAAQTFDSASYVGWDTAGGNIGRRWTGGVDEMMIFNRALSPVEVNALYLGVPGSATLTIVPSGSHVILTWPGGKLLEATSLTGPWVTNNAAASPYTVSAAGAGKFYRVQLQP